MSDELLAEIRRLKAENKKLTDGLSELSGELKEVRGEARDRRHEARTLAQQLADLAADRDQWRSKAETDPEGWQARVDELRGTVRALRHDRCYEAVARRLKVSDPTKLADLLKLSGHAPEADEPDEAQITETFRAALKGRPWLVDDEAGASTQAPGGANVDVSAEPTAAGSPAGTGGKPGPGADRGQSLSVNTGPARSKVPGRL